MNYLYASTQRFIEGKTGDASGISHVHWGTIDADKVFHPYPGFLYLSPEEHRKFIFPDDWNLKELEQYSAASEVPVNQSVISVEQHIGEKEHTVNVHKVGRYVRSFLKYVHR